MFSGKICAFHHPSRSHLFWRSLTTGCSPQSWFGLDSDTIAALPVFPRSNPYASPPILFLPFKVFFFLIFFSCGLLLFPLFPPPVPSLFCGDSASGYKTQEKFRTDLSKLSSSSCIFLPLYLSADSPIKTFPIKVLVISGSQDPVVDGTPQKSWFYSVCAVCAGYSLSCFVLPGILPEPRLEVSPILCPPSSKLLFLESLFPQLHFSISFLSESSVPPLELIESQLGRSPL